MCANVIGIKEEKSVDDVDVFEGKTVRADFSADYVPMRKQPIDLSNTENPLGCSDLIADAIKNAFPLISRYPERCHNTLIDALSRHLALPDECLFAGNGATGCIQNVVMTFVGKDDHVILPELSFPLPIFAATTMGGCGVKVPVKEDFRIDFDALLHSISKRTKLVFLCNPNNPTGLYENPTTIIDFARKVEVPVLVSEASIEYAGTSLLESFATWPDNLIVVRSFSKAHGLAGLRVGYGIAKPAMVKEIIRFQLPFAISRLSQMAAVTSLADNEHVKHSVSFVQEERKFLCDRLTSMGFAVIPPQSNMLLVGCFRSGLNGSTLSAALDKMGITVLNGIAFSPSLAQYIRVSPRKREINEVFLAAMQKAIEDLE